MWILLNSPILETYMWKSKPLVFMPKMGFSNWVLSSIIEIISRKSLKKYGLSLSCWNIPSYIKNWKMTFFILIGRNTSLLNQLLNSHYLQVPPISKWRMDFFLLFLYKKQHCYSCIGLHFNSPLLVRTIFIDRSENFYDNASVT